MARHKDFGTIRVRIQLPSNDDQKAIVGGVESKLNDIGGDIVTSMLAIITGNNQKKPIGDIFNKGISIGNDGTLFSNVHSINEGISQIVNILNDTKGSSVLANMLTDLDFICAKIVNDANNSKEATATLAIDTSNAGNLEQIIEEIKNLASDTKSIDIDGFTDIESFFIMLNELTNKDGIITQAVNNTNNIPNLSKKANKNIHSLTAFLTAMNTLASLDPKKLKDGADNIKDVVDYLNQVLADIGQSDIEDNIKTVKKSFELIRELYDDDIKVTAEAVKSHAADLSAIKLGLGDTYETVIESGDKMSSWDMDDFEVTAGDVAGAIALMGFVMLIGGMIIRDHPELILESIKFGGVLSVFLLELSVPIVLLGALNSKFDASFESLSDLTLFITVASFVMLIGASVMKNKTMWARSLLFGVVFTLFLTGILGAIWFTSRNLDPKLFENLNKLSVLIVTCTLVMLIGAYFVKSNLWKLSFQFGVILAGFMLAVLLPFTLLGAIFKKTIQIADGVVKFIITCTLIMLIGAAIVALGGGKYWHDALFFGQILFAFLLAVTIPILGLALFKEKAEDTINAVRKYIITSIIIMMLGVVFMNLKGGKYVLDALQFGVVFGLFLFAILTPIFIFAIFNKKASKILLSVTVFILTCAAVLYLGAMMSQSGMFNDAWKFAATLAGFIFAILLPFKWLGKSGSLDKAWPLLISLSLFVGVCGYLLIQITKSEVDWKQLWIFGVFEGFIVAVIGISILLTKATKNIDLKQLKNFTAITFTITLVILGITYALIMMKKAGINWKDIGLFAVLNAIIVAVTALIMVISRINKENVMNAVIIMFSISTLLLITIGTIWLMKKANIDEKDIVRFGIINAIVVAMLALVMTISRINKEKDGVMNAIKTMWTIGILMVITVGTIWLMKKVNITKEDVERFGMINLIVLAMTTLVMLISRINRKPGEVDNAIALMWSTTILIALTIGTIWLMKKANITKEDVERFGMINLIVGAMGLLVSLIGLIARKKYTAIAGISVILAVTLCIIGVTYAIKIIKESGADKKTINLLWELCGIVAALTVFTGLIGYLASKHLLAAIAGLAVLGVITYCIVQLSEAIAKVAESGVNQKTLNMIWEMCGVVAALTAFSGLIGGLIVGTGGIGALVAGAGMAVIFGIIKLIDLLANVMVKISNAAKIANEVENPEAIGQILSSFFGAFKNLSIGSAAKILLVGKKIAKTIDLLCEPLAKVVTIIKDISSMKIATEWDKKGRPTKYRELTPEDFTKFSQNISDILMVIPNGIAPAAEALKKVKQKNLKKTLEVCNELGQVIANITDGVKSYAKLLIPDKWDPKTGKPIHYTLMKKENFEDAAIGISTIIVTMSQGIKDASDKLKKMDQKEINKTIKNSQKLAKLISNIAKAVISYSKLIIPDEWDPETGKAKHYHLMNESDFTEAGKSISAILLATTQGVIIAHNEYAQIMDEGKFKKITKSFLPISTLISDTSKGVKDIVELNIPIYDENGNVIGKQKLTDKDFKDLGENLSILMGATSQGILEADKKLRVSGLDPTSKEFKRIVESFAPIGEFIANVAVGIKEYANATYTTSDGKKITVDGPFIQEAGKNITDLLSIITNALAQYYNEHKEDILKDDTLKKIALQYKEVVDVINGIISSIKDIASIDSEVILSAVSTIDRILNGEKEGETYKEETSILSILTKSFTGESDFSVLKENVKNTKEALTSIFGIITMIANNDENIKKIADNNYQVIDDLSGLITKIKNILEEIIKKSEPFIDSNKKAVAINGLFKLFDLVNGNLSTSINKLSKLIESINKLNIESLTYKDKTNNEIKSIIYKILDPVINIITAINEATLEEINKDKIKLLKKNISSIEQLVLRMNISLKKIAEFDSLYKKSINGNTPFNDIIETIKEFNNAFKNIETELTDKSQEISIKNLNKIERKVESFSEIVRNIINATSNTLKNPAIFDQIKEGIKKINTEIDNVNDETTDKLNKEVKSLDKFVKSVDRIDLTRVTKLTSLMEAMANLADKMGGFDKLAELLDGDLKEVLNGLANTVDEAKKTIETSEKINKQRQAELKKNLEKFSELMDKNILVGVSEMDKDGNLKVSSEKLKKS